MTFLKRFSAGLLGLSALFFCVLLFLFPKEAAAGVTKSLSLCARSLIPSLFVFSVLSQILVESRIFSVLGRVGRPLGLSAAGTAVFFIGLFAGFPMGAAAAETLVRHRELSEEEARAVVPYASNAGMAFAVGAVGEGMLNSKRLGMLLYGLQTLLSLIFLLLGTPKRKKRGFAAENTALPSGAAPSVTEILVSSVSHAGSAMIAVCAYVLFFGAAADFLLLLTRPLLPSVLRPFLCAFLEIGRGCSEFSRLFPQFPRLGLCGVGFSLGFSGLSVAFQVADRSRAYGLSVLSFLLKKSLFGIVMALCCFLL